MDIVLQLKSEKLNKVKDILLKDDTVNRASIKFKEGSEFDVEGYICYISGTDERCARALEIIKVKDEEGNVTEELAEQVEEAKKDEIIKKIKEEEDKAIEGFGGIFG